MSKVCKCVAEAFRMMDLFSTSELLRYKGEPEYRTVTGGCTSFLVIVLFLTLFFSEGLKTSNKEIIFASETIVNEADPSFMDITLDPKNGFMLGMFVPGLDLNDPNQVPFNLQLIQHYEQPVGLPINQTVVPLEACTAAHFNYSDELVDYFNKLDGHKWKCPPIGYTLRVGGRITSDVSASFGVYLSKCNSTVEPNCTSDSILATQSDLSLVMPTINSILNPSEKEYRKIFIEDNNYFTFSAGLTAEGNNFVE